MAKCSKCGAELLEGALFCTECGTAITSPFEGENTSTSNPFEDFDNNVPKPQTASELIFGETVYDHAVQAELKADEAAKIAAEAQAKAEATKEDWSGQTGYGKPSFDPDAKEEAPTETPKPSFEAGTEGSSWSGSSQQQPTWGAQTGTQQGAWSQKDQENQQGQQSWSQQAQPQQNWNQQYNQGYGNNYGDYIPTTGEKALCILSYFTVLLWVITYLISGSKGVRSEFSKFHFGCSLILNVVGVIAGWIGGNIGSALAFVVFIYAIMGVIYVAQGKMRAMSPLDRYRIFK